MGHDFDTVIDRRHTASEKWDGMEARYGVSPDEGIALWVADMEFRPPPAVNRSLEEAAEHGIHGYAGGLDFYYDSIVHWMERRHDWRIEPGQILSTHGIVNAVCQLIQAFCEPGDGVIIQPPVYYPFFGAIRANGCRVIENRLVAEDQHYVMDLDDLARRVDRRTRMLILCSPHNPGGRVWSRAELEALAAFCVSRNILIVSDEIHHDLVYEGSRHTVLATLDRDVARRVVTCTSASKTFNLAGTQTGNVVITDEPLRRRFRHRLAASGIHAPNRLGALAAAAAYTHGEPWLADLLLYLRGNRDRVQEVVEKELPGVSFMPLEATYLAWLDFAGTGLTMPEIIRRVQEGARLALNHGPTFGPGGERHLRLNFACARSQLDEALDRLVRAFR